MPKKRVYACFPKDLNNWSTKAMDWSAVTHLIVRAVVAQPDGTVRPGHNTTPENLKAIVDEAHKNNVKAVILLWGDGPKVSSKYLAEAPQKMADSLLAFVKEHNLDGVSLDDESWQKENIVTKGPNRDLVTNFCKALRKTFKSARADYDVSYCSPPIISAKNKRGESWMDYKALADELDAFCIMSYCMFPPSINWTGASQPIEGGLDEHPRDYTTCINDYLEATGGKKEKLFIGFDNNRGGVEWKVRSEEPFTKIYPLIEKPRLVKAAEAQEKAAKHGRKWEPKQKAPWYCYKDGDHFVQGWYNDDESQAAILALAREKDIGGILIWVLDGANEPPATFKLIHKHLLQDESK